MPSAAAAATPTFRNDRRVVSSLRCPIFCLLRTSTASRCLAASRSTPVTDRRQHSSPYWECQRPAAFVRLATRLVPHPCPSPTCGGGAGGMGGASRHRLHP